ASSWKGEQGSALACVEANRNYFMTIAREAFARGRLMMSAMRLNGRPLAQRLSFIAGSGAFAFKTAYDENHAGSSPGMLLEIDNIQRLHTRTDVEWMDSCATPIHFINRLWTDRRAIRSVLISTGRKSGDLLVEIMPLMKRLSRGLRSIKQSAATKEKEK
ncbi:MAG TPA: GNAT family N-acetyltransferase, partial [Blastocatellia bacterium]|nr:GNAT family N-acetyltransferase [Blastocatellia bacterium]